MTECDSTIVGNCADRLYRKAASATFFYNRSGLLIGFVRSGILVGAATAEKDVAACCILADWNALFCRTEVLKPSLLRRLPAYTLTRGGA
jgi:hypothetical protein